MDPRYSMSNHPLGGGAAVLLLFIYVRAHQLPRVWNWFISFFNIPCVHVYTFALRSRSHTKKLRSSFSLARSVYPLRSVPRESCVPHPSFLQGTQPPQPPKSLRLHRRFLFPDPPLSKNLGINSPRSPPFRPAPSPKIWLDFSSQPGAQLDFWFQPPGQPPSPLPPNSLLYPVSFPPPPLQFHNLTLNGVRGAGARAGVEVVEENFKAPSAVKKKPIPPPLLFFFFFKARGGFRFLCPRPHPGTGSSSSRCCRTRWAGPGSRGRRVTRSLAGGPGRSPGSPLLHQWTADPGALRRKKFTLSFYFKWGGRCEGTKGVLGN